MITPHLFIQNPHYSRAQASLACRLFLACQRATATRRSQEPLSSEPDGVVIEESHMEVMEVGSGCCTL